MNRLHKFPGGLNLKGFKDISTTGQIRPAVIPEYLCFYYDQHTGTPCHPVVKKGDQVLKGQVIAASSSYVSTTIHASSSGTVTAVDTKCITIETDGKDCWCEKMPPMDYSRCTNEQLEQRIADAGIIGMGGAGFPSHVKVVEGADDEVETLIINGVECEPYITCDDSLIRERAAEIILGAVILKKIVSTKRCVVATEADMPGAYDALLSVVQEEQGIEILQVPAIYPAGSEKQLIQTITGKIVPSHTLPIGIGTLVLNVATVTAIYRAVVQGEPLISRIMTITGEIEEPCNREVLNGTPILELLKCTTYRSEDLDQVLIGGPMMGVEIDPQCYVTSKKCSCLLIRKRPASMTPFPCIRCGDCVDVCPVKLQPQQLYSLARTAEGRVSDEIKENRLFDCIQCGCCDYVCPSHIPLVSSFVAAKSAIQVEDASSHRADQSRSRYHKHLQRLEQENAQREQERAKKRLKGKSGQSAQKNADQKVIKDIPGANQKNIQDEIKAAIARSKLKRKGSMAANKKPG